LKVFNFKNSRLIALFAQGSKRLVAAPGTKVRFEPIVRHLHHAQALIALMHQKPRHESDCVLIPSGASTIGLIKTQDSGNLIEIAFY
jgi:hypothetical protein